VTVVDRPTISGQFSGRFMLTFAVPSALGHAAARARRLLRPIGKANNLNEIRPGSARGGAMIAADLHYDRHSENGERAGPDDPGCSIRQPVSSVATKERLYL
jgi:hypothetical protein